MISRRDSMKWVAAAIAVLPAFPALAQAEESSQPIILLDPVVPWPQGELPAVTGPGYGTDPDLMDPKAPWPLILSEGVRQTVTCLADLILPRDDVSPGAGDVGVAAFIDEWVSSPYPDQANDRKLILHGLTWLDAQAQAMAGKGFAESPMPVQTRILDSLIARRDGTPLERPAAFFARVRVLIIAGFYTLPEGKTALEFHGNTPVIGAYPGPTEAAMAHFHGLLASLNLQDPGKPWEKV